MDPPLGDIYKTLLHKENADAGMMTPDRQEPLSFSISEILEEVELPVIDLSRLMDGENEEEREKCKEEMAQASREWGFLQVINHGIPTEVLERIRQEQIRVFRQPFAKKETLEKFSVGSYRWGAPTATRLRQLSWSEALHIPVKDISQYNEEFPRLRSAMEEFAWEAENLAETIAEVLAEKIGRKWSTLREGWARETSYLRMNRYPPCPEPSEVYGLMPHTDSDFITVLQQDHVGGLQLIHRNRWLTVKPNPLALLINIGDLFQAWSNDVYKSVVHRVMTNPTAERFSTVYFFCPPYDAVIECSGDPPLYKCFSFREYRQQVRHDVEKLGFKVGLPRFLSNGGVAEETELNAAF